MLRLIWKDGRFSWALIAVIVFLTISVLAVDVAWRVVKVQFETLLIYAVLVDAATAAILIVVIRLILRARVRSRV